MSEYHFLPLAALEQPPFCTVILFLCVELGVGLGALDVWMSDTSLAWHDMAWNVEDGDGSCEVDSMEWDGFDRWVGWVIKSLALRIGSLKWDMILPIVVPMLLCK